jgi:hypothetical protein
MPFKKIYLPACVQAFNIVVSLTCTFFSLFSNQLKKHTLTIVSPHGMAFEPYCRTKIYRP